MAVGCKAYGEALSTYKHILGKKAATLTPPVQMRLGTFANLFARPNVQQHLQQQQRLHLNCTKFIAIYYDLNNISVVRNFGSFAKCVVVVFDSIVC